MQKKQLTKLVVLLTTLACSAAGAGDWQEFADDQTEPAIYGNTIVWQDSRNGNWNIYAVILDGPAVAQCTAAIQGDVNGDCKVDLTDFAVMTAHWLECNLEPQEFCWQ